MADINATKITRFEDGGTFAIGADTVLNIVSGTLRVRPGGRPPIIDYDRAVMLTDIREGDDQPSEVSLDVRITNSTDLTALLVADGDDGYKPDYTVVISRPLHRAATSGIRLTLNKAVVQSYEFTAGAEFDTLSITFIVPDHNPAWTAYAP